jgi:predicted dehydrogenase
LNRLKFAIIGCGRISKKHVEALVNNQQEAELVAVCDVIEDKAKAIKALYEKQIGYSKVTSYTNYKEMLVTEEIDVVAIATESGYHADITVDCLNTGCHVIVEKPMALSTQDADRMIEAAKKNKRKLCVCHQNRFNPPIQLLKRAIDDGRFGKLVNGTARILWNRNDAYYAQADWRGTYRLDGGTLMNQCIHNIDLLTWMVGSEVDNVYAQIDTFLRSIEAEDFGAIVVRFKNGVIGIIEGSACVFPENLEETLSIFGEKGTAVIGGIAVNKIETWRFADGLDKEEEIMARQGEDPESVYGYGHTPLYKDMIYAIKENREPYITGEDGKKAISIILAAYKSQQTGQPVKFPLGDFSTIDMLK